MLKLISLLCQWHGLAKLRMHTDATLRIMDGVTRRLGDSIRDFEANTCPAFNSRELKGEAEKRQRRETLSHSQSQCTTSATATPARQPRTFNLRTYKLHALRDYVASIRMYGTMDSYSTQPVRIPFHLCCFRVINFDLRENGNIELQKGDIRIPVARTLFIN